MKEKLSLEATISIGIGSIVGGGILRF